MTKNHWRIIPESVFIHVKVSTTDSAIANFDFDLLVATNGLFHILQLNIPEAGLIFD
jgi:hypothetical protein